MLRRLCVGMGRLVDWGGFKLGAMGVIVFVGKDFNVIMIRDIYSSSYSPV